jgi:threonine/homoserine/homoserine lactone efflux protein
MDFPTLSAFAVFVCVMTGTPGPGNLTFLAIGSSRGFKAAFPIIIAAQIGNVPVNVLIALGLGAIMSAGGPLQTVFTYASLAYMIYLAWRIVLMTIKENGDVRPPSFWEGLWIHPLSPKTWAMGVSAYGLFLTDTNIDISQKLLFLVVGFMLGGLVFHSLWAFVGESMLRMLGNGRTMRIVTIVMALLMVAVSVWSLMS